MRKKGEMVEGHLLFEIRTKENRRKERSGVSFMFSSFRGQPGVRFATSANPKSNHLVVCLILVLFIHIFISYELLQKRFSQLTFKKRLNLSRTIDSLQSPFDWHPAICNGFSLCKKRTSLSPSAQLKINSLMKMQIKVDKLTRNERRPSLNPSSKASWFSTV